LKARRVKGLDPEAPLADNAERIIRVRLQELYDFTPRALDPRNVTELHDMRIAAKRLRYLLELTDLCFGPYAAKAAGRVKEVQDLLGEIHDCDVMLPRVHEEIERVQVLDAAEVTRRAGDAEDLDPALSAGAPHVDVYRGLDALIVHLLARRDLLFARFLELWRDLQRDGFRARLDYALAERPEVSVAEPDPEPDEQPLVG
jgi:hypothetical protein